MYREANMRACIHRGSQEIGGSCVELEQEGKRIVLDLGLPLNCDSKEGEKDYLPNIQGLDGNDPSLLGIFTSHSHLDHTGLIKHISPDIPVGMGPAARRIMTVAAPFLPEKFPIPSSGWDYQAWETFNVGPFCITPFLVDHSAYDSYALLIEAEGKRIFYSGDFRSHGRKSVLFDNMLNSPPDNINVLFLEGSSLGRIENDQQFLTESDIEKELVEDFKNNSGLVMVHASAQNIDRVVSIMRAAKQTERTLIMDLYTAAVLEATGNKKIPQSYWPEIALFVPQPQRIQIKKKEWFDQLQRHSTNRIYMDTIRQNPGKYVLLYRPLFMSDLNRENFLKHATYIYSQWEGYWERGDYKHVSNWLQENEIIKKSLHTSGHASPGDLRKLAHSLNPDKIVPIHSFMPEKYNKLFQNVEFHGDGEFWEV